jgi:2-oxoacid:acceptor oxidoreductase gamma subunit (pyruvate/2-ketoisovalerate family)
MRRRVNVRVPFQPQDRHREASTRHLLDLRQGSTRGDGLTICRACGRGISPRVSRHPAGNGPLLQIVIQGRGGQGAQTAGTLLASAFFAEGRYVQSFATYGGARRGTPVSSFIRVDERPIRVRCDIERADAILCFDASLLQGRLLACARPDTPIVVNSSRTREEFGSTLAGYRVIPVDGIAIARRHGLGRIVNSALLGAFAAAIDAPGLDVLSRALIEEAPKLHDENRAACEDGYRCVEASLQAVEA